MQSFAVWTAVQTANKVICYSCICTAVNSQGWHCHICMLSNFLCSCIWSAPYMLQTLQEVLLILVPTTLAPWSSHSCLEMAPSAAFEYWFSRFLPETLHGGYVAVEHLGWVAVFPLQLHDFCSRIALVLFDWWRSKDWLCHRGWLFSLSSFWNRSESTSKNWYGCFLRDFNDFGSFQRALRKSGWRYT